MLIAATDLLPSLGERLAAGREVVAFSDDEPLRALAEITRRRPAVVALERLVAASPRGAALIARIKADPALKGTEVLVVSRDGEHSRVSPRTRAAVVPAHATPAGLDGTGTRRAPRVRMEPDVATVVEGNPATLVDLSVVGAQVVSVTVLRPNQRVKITLRDAEVNETMNATVVWARLEPARKASGPAYRCGLEFSTADADLIEAYCQRHRAG